ncbi:hypothetical protein H113_07798 [Trichophyton rubrum MR1459]|uniref:Uncharacterized protein n=1 Tax=Trichophyton rubrum (strain ATCC MYA-4607 / CBS 118892) TaxID=559305 RepID=A0A087PFL8_TRIRC|nr:uncharacterized protein TERG_11542 [Trichophyton rubrum CBS 118892]EZF91209.1 hypothetical protein H113_07798 [Trichophyton rubrum MR1459]EZG02344.1 hypothetical protein H106_07574 [Trichophyton rubrum CBS 735.88]KFL60171.1 hypothetical protein TERG_11542 [Trichophyton rubrum CBS 118892]
MYERSSFILSVPQISNTPRLELFYPTHSLTRHIFNTEVKAKGRKNAKNGKSQLTEQTCFHLISILRHCVKFFVEDIHRLPCKEHGTKHIHNYMHETSQSQLESKVSHPPAWLLAPFLSSFPLLFSISGDTTAATFCIFPQTSGPAHCPGLQTILQPACLGLSCLLLLALEPYLFHLVYGFDLSILRDLTGCPAMPMLHILIMPLHVFLFLVPPAPFILA